MSDPTSATPELAVFEHEKRREWGLGILAWERKHKRGYLFENGQLRIVAEDFYSMMHEVDRPRDEVRALYNCLRRELNAAQAENGPPQRVARTAGTPMSFDDQLAVFHSEFPKGFEDPQWLQKQRGVDAKARLGGHRNPALAEAQAKLGARELSAHISQQQFRAITDDVLAVLEHTDLVPGADLAVMKKDASEPHRELGAAIVDFLHGKGGFGARFQRFLGAFEQAFGKPASWQLATALPALVHPSEHVCIRPTSFREQARWMAPRLAFPKLPSVEHYIRALSMAKLVSSKLIERSETPADLMDVHDFIRITTRTAAKKLLIDIKAAKSPGSASQSP